MARRSLVGLAVVSFAALLLIALAPLSVGAGTATPSIPPSSSIPPPSSVGAETEPPSIPLLVSVTAQDLGRFDRVTFTFTTGDLPPEILAAEFGSRPAVFSPSGLPVEPPIAGVGYFEIVMSGASGVDLFASPPVPSYTGPQRFAVDLPNVTELVQLGDFEATLSWAIGVNDASVTPTVRVLSDPTRVEVDIPHASPVQSRPSFTG